MKKQTNKKNQSQEKKLKTEVLLQVGTKEDIGRSKTQSPIKQIKQYGKTYNVYSK